MAGHDCVEDGPKAKDIRRFSGFPRFPGIRNARIWVLSTVYITAGRSTEVTELKAKAVYRIGVEQVVLRLQVGEDNALLVDKVYGFCCLRTPFQSQGKIDCVIMLINMTLEITMTGFSEKQPARVYRRADEPFEAISTGKLVWPILPYRIILGCSPNFVRICSSTLKLCLISLTRR